MKKRLASIFLALCIITALPHAFSEASQMLCFTGVNDTLLPLRSATMPAYFGTKLYVPSSVFTEFGISSGTSSSQEHLIVYRSGVRLTFYISLGLVMDQDGNTHENAALKIIDGLYFLPLDFICEFFGLTRELLSNDPVSVLRIKNSDAVFNDKTFVGHYKKQIEEEYKEYNAPVTATPTPVPTPTPGDIPPTETPLVQDHSGVTVYLSFCNVTEQYATTILDTLASYSITACFFLSASDISDNPALVRRISGEKHMVGIWLESAEYEEYLNAARLLFDAAKLVTPLVASDKEIAIDAANMCREYGLIYRASTIQPAGNANAATIAALLSVTPYTADDLRLECSQNTTRVLSAIIKHLNNNSYTVSTITETSPLL